MHGLLCRVQSALLHSTFYYCERHLHDEQRHECLHAVQAACAVLRAEAAAAAEQAAAETEAAAHAAQLQRSEMAAEHQEEEARLQARCNWRSLPRVYYHGVLQLMLIIFNWQALQWYILALDWSLCNRILVGMCTCIIRACPRLMSCSRGLYNTCGQRAGVMSWLRNSQRSRRGQLGARLLQQSCAASLKRLHMSLGNCRSR